MTFEFKYLNKFTVEFEKALGYETGAQVASGKRGKSRTVSLRLFKMFMYPT
jgi:hypothetical protein